MCGVGIALVTGLDAAGVKINGQPISTVAASDSSAVNNLLSQCSATLGTQLLGSGALTSAGVAQLTKCDIQAASNSCLSGSPPPTPVTPPTPQAIQGSPAKSDAEPTKGLQRPAKVAMISAAVTMLALLVADLA